MLSFGSCAAFIVPSLSLAFALLAGPGHAQTVSADQPANFTVFLQGVAVGAEQVTVVRTPQGITISGDERIGPPLHLVTRRAEIRYTADWRPLDCLIEGSARDEAVVLHTTVSGTTVTTDFTQGTKPGRKTDQIAADALLLPEHLLRRLRGAGRAPLGREGRRPRERSTFRPRPRRR